MQSIRERVNDALEIRFQKHTTGVSFLVNISLSILIFMNTVAIILHTIPSLGAKYDRYFFDFELFSVLVFSVEYIMRVWSIVEQPGYSHPVWGRLKFIFSAWGIIDFLAIFPFYFSLFNTDLGFVRMFRVLRMIRLFRVSKYFRAITEIQNVIIHKKEELVLSFSFILFLLFISSSLMFFLEHNAQPEAFSSIPAALWWGVNAMATVGYGDIIPVTNMGKLLSGIFSIIGMGLFALPTGILASGFAEQINAKKNGVKCPHCGGTVHLPH